MKTDHLLILMLYCDRAPNGQYENSLDDIAKMLDVKLEEIEQVVRDASVFLLKKHVLSRK